MSLVRSQSPARIVCMKYLTHNFIPHTFIDSNDGRKYTDSYNICETCGVIILYGRYAHKDFTNEPPYISNNWAKTTNGYNIQLTLTCDEIIIKKLLE